MWQHSQHLFVVVYEEKSINNCVSICISRSNNLLNIREKAGIRSNKYKNDNSFKIYI